MVSKHIIGIRVAKDMRQTVLAKRAGLKPSVIKDIEAGRLVPNRGLLRRIADALEADAEWLRSGLLDVGESYSLRAAKMSLTRFLQNNRLASIVVADLQAVITRTQKRLPTTIDHWGALARDLQNLGPARRRQYGL